MIFKIKRHNSILYSTLLTLSRNLYFYNKINLKDTYETRIYLMFMHFSIILITRKNRNEIFPQSYYDNLFFSIENNLRELGQGDVAVNKKMKDLNKIFYDILIKIFKKERPPEINKSLILKYFDEFKNLKDDKYLIFEQYLIKFNDFCFELSPEIVIKEAIKFKVN
tara:strand:+ start:1859 stop:2356 length:498 start_codon:yes stop_codon:yes gene_type:complete